MELIIFSIGDLLPLGYIGPGAGFAFVGSFLIFAVALFAALLAFLTWPLRAIHLAFLRRKRSHKPLVKRVVVVGLDGLHPPDIRRLMATGDCPNFKRLQEQGCFSELDTTCPPISPVAWSSFTTGVNPGKHNIFDFLNRDLRTYMPELSSCRVETGQGQKRFGRPRTSITGKRKSKPFWHWLGDCGVPCTILRVPITFPVEPFRGRCLAAMCIPDLRGTQGEFTVFETTGDSGDTPTGGRCITVTVTNGCIETALPGPSDGKRTLEIPVKIRLGRDRATLSIDRQKVHLETRCYSDWIPIRFRSGFTRVQGICKFLLLSTAPGFRLYVTPIHIDPEKPAMPISHPVYYSIYLAKLHDRYATLGLAEDTWALSEGVIDQEDFRKQAYDIQDERERMFMESLKRTRHGLLACVFDLPDRIQHMFRRSETEDEQSPVVDQMCRDMDALVGRVLDAIDRHTLLLVMSDHGFGEFRRGFNLNAWLREQGYLDVSDEVPAGDYFTGVNWSATRAYAFGLSGIYINKSGREKHGIVAAGDEHDALCAEISARLMQVRDAETGQPAIRQVYHASKIYSGPYSENGPDLIVGYDNGYRASWQCAVGRTDGELFIDNDKAWQADHCMDPAIVPGVLFSNRRLASADRPHIMDLAPTILNAFGVQAPGHMDGKVLPFES